MTVNIKIKTIKEYGKLISTGIFWVSDFMAERDLSELLNKSRVFITNLTVDHLVNDNEIHLMGYKNDDGWTIECRQLAKPTFDDIREQVLILTGLKYSELMDCDRHAPRPLARSVISAASFHFLKYSFSKLNKQLPTDRSTLYQACKKSLPEFLNSKDYLASSVVNALAYRYGDSSFITRCRKGDFTSKPRFI